MTIIGLINPYISTNIITFFKVLVSRFLFFIKGQGGINDLFVDEVQIVTLVMVAISCALIGVFLVMRRMTMLANALSHTVLIGIVIAYAFTSKSFDFSYMNISTLFIAAGISGVITVVFSEVFHRYLHLQKDASVGIVFTSLFALGVVLVSLLSKNSRICIEIITGNIDVLHKNDIKLVFMIFLINLFVVTIFFKELHAFVFDATFAKLLGIPILFFNCILMLQTSITVIGAFRVVGVVVVLSFITGPVLISRIFTKNIKSLIVVSTAVGIFVAVVSVALSRHFLSVNGIALSTSGILVVTLIALYILAIILSSTRGVMASLVSKKISKPSKTKATYCTDRQ
jgi:manganese/zinc/iron transport system permease protein